MATATATKGKNVKGTKAKAGKNDKKKAPKVKPAGFRDTLTKRQIRVLTVLAKAKGPITRVTILDRITDHNLGNSLGHREPEGRANRDAELGYKSLLTLGYAKQVLGYEIEGRKQDVYTITATGKKALAKAGK